MGIGTAVGIGAGALSSGLAAHEAGKAANTQANAATQAAQIQANSANQALDFEKQQYADEQKLLQPYQAAGTQALTGLEGMPAFQAPGADFTQDPGYQFRVAEGMKAIQNSAAAKGNVLSGGTAKALDQYAGGEASQEYGNAYNRNLTTYQTNRNNLLQLAGFGQNATNTGVSAAANTGQAVSNTLQQQGADIAGGVQNAGAARASGYASTGNILSNGINSNVNNYLLYSQLKNLQPAATPPFVPAYPGQQPTSYPG